MYLDNLQKAINIKFISHRSRLYEFLCDLRNVAQAWPAGST